MTCVSSPWEPQGEGWGRAAGALNDLRVWTWAWAGIRLIGGDRARTSRHARTRAAPLEGEKSRLMPEGGGRGGDKVTTQRKMELGENVLLLWGEGRGFLGGEEMQEMGLEKNETSRNAHAHTYIHTHTHTCPHQRTQIHIQTHTNTSSHVKNNRM